MMTSSGRSLQASLFIFLCLAVNFANANWCNLKISVLVLVHVFDRLFYDTSSSYVIFFILFMVVFAASPNCCYFKNFIIGLVHVFEQLFYNRLSSYIMFFVLLCPFLTDNFVRVYSFYETY